MAEARKAASNTKRKMEVNNNEQKRAKQQRDNKLRLPNSEKLDESFNNRMLKEMGIRKTLPNAPTPNLNVERKKTSNPEGTTNQENNPNTSNHSEGKWETQKKYSRNYRARSNSNTSDESSNSFNLLNNNDNMDTNETRETTGKNNEQSKRKRNTKCPPIMVTNTNIKEIITILDGNKDILGPKRKKPKDHKEGSKNNKRKQLHRTRGIIRR
ncbi:hypothetical protein PV327_004150 [Microctonus hyperodae]|uniref:Uncharacterized protein n=1 Tax=Microctonus hyperodae TaxID=165561 RepID=A0AA39KM70_MICHY|nr:hypothetical protein PV327_004150 [Microctonus hyperodae]